MNDVYAYSKDHLTFLERVKIHTAKPERPSQLMNDSILHKHVRKVLFYFTPVGILIYVISVFCWYLNTCG